MVSLAINFLNYTFAWLNIGKLKVERSFVIFQNLTNNLAAKITKLRFHKTHIKMEIKKLENKKHIEQTTQDSVSL